MYKDLSAGSQKEGKTKGERIKNWEQDRDRHKECELETRTREPQRQRGQGMEKQVDRLSGGETEPGWGDPGRTGLEVGAA